MKIDNYLNNKELLHVRIDKILTEELIRQKKAGKKFISDEEIDKLIKEIMIEELGNNYKEKY